MKSNKEYNHYASCHQKIHRKFGRAIRCENANCNGAAPKRFEWALRKGRTYSDNIEDYMQLCPSCHRKYDYNKEQGLLHSKRMKGRKPTKKQLIALSKGRTASIKPLLQYSKEEVFIREWGSITKVYEDLGILQSSISNCLKNKSKTAGGFIWKLKNQQE